MFADGTLQIIGLYRYDSGLYICMASNGIGEPIRKEVYLTVKGMGIHFNHCSLLCLVLRNVVQERIAFMRTWLLYSQNYTECVLL